MGRRWYQSKNHLVKGGTPPLYKPVEDILAKIVKGKKVLDIGCNAGLVSFLASKNGAYSVTGLDFESIYFQQALEMKSKWEEKYNLKNIKFHKGNIIENLDLISENNFFMFLRVLYHIRSYEEKTPNSIRTGVELVFNRIRQVKNPIIFLQGNPGRYKYVKEGEGLWGSNGQSLATIDGMKLLLKKFGFHSTVMPEEIVIGTKRDDKDLRERIIKCLKG